ncbi:hypothetical protein HYPSUDRAFT_115550, partial [Hypholoma sublateritium FD-334 SS-4]
NCVACGRNFSQISALSNHVRTCRFQKKRTASALEGAKEIYRNKKNRVATNQTQTCPGESSQQADVTTRAAIATVGTPNAMDIGSVDDDSLSLAKRRPRRENRPLPKRFQNEQPVALASLPPAAAETLQASNDSTLSTPVVNLERRTLTSPLNKFGLFRRYFSASFPAHDPDTEIQIEELSEVSQYNNSNTLSTSFFEPYPNRSAFLLGEWYWNSGVQKTKEGFCKLINIISGSDFNPADVKKVPWDSLNRRLGESVDSEDVWIDEPDAGWKETSITLPIPFHKNMLNPGLQQYTFPPFCHRSIVSVLKEKMSNQRDFQQFHLEPYELRWQRKDTPDTESTRVHGELYTSAAFLEAHEEIQSAVGEPGCSLPRVLIGLMFGSDGTQLTSFGSTSLWPCYMYFGNESKYRRCRPTCNLCNHIAYFQKLPPEFKDFAELHWGKKGPSDSFMTHCQREFLHAQWKELLDDEFLEAYEHGIVIECCDGKKRRFYLRIFAYTADYPEKILLSSIRNMGNCPCPRCLIPKHRTHQLATRQDQRQRKSLARVDNLQYRVKTSSAHEIIYQKNCSVDSVAIQRLLKPESLTPNENAFSCKLSKFGFNLFSIFLVDFMHEFELGVWKKVFIHLLRILDCVDGAVNELDQRFRSVPTFGRDSIRRFANSVSELKRLGARDYENILQCSIPVFEGLLPKEHNDNLMDVLFTLAHWHALAKLRQHTDLSLDILESITVQLGRLLRKFQEKTCPAYNTRELQRELTSRARKAASKLSTNKTTSKNTSSLPTKTASTYPKKEIKGRLPKTLNLNTYKDHSLGDYVDSIRRNGTVDSYSTESMELEHRSPKSRYLRTSRKHFEKQLGCIERCQARIRRIRQKLDKTKQTREELVHEKGPESWASAYHIGKTQNHPVDLRVFAQEKRHDPAAKDFMKNLKAHLLPRIHSRIQVDPHKFGFENADAAEMAQNMVLIKDNRVYSHKLARFYHTTYDVRRSEDVINPRTSHCNVMLLCKLATSEGNSLDTSVTHPFLYARVIGIYHVNVVYTGPGMKGYESMHFDFLHIRWFQLEAIKSQGRHRVRGWASLRLDRLSFPPMAEKSSFAFVDPALVLRSCHLIPAFSSGKRYSDGIGLSALSRDNSDWKMYYVNRFADRDMTMRYHWGLGIGHMYSHN